MRGETLFAKSVSPRTPFYRKYRPDVIIRGYRCHGIYFPPQYCSKTVFNAAFRAAGGFPNMLRLEKKETPLTSGYF